MKFNRDSWRNHPCASLPSRERGLKSVWLACGRYRTEVAPFAGAWIEMCKRCLTLLLWCVAPFAGAWIEILPAALPLLRACVAPFTGAWIEMGCPTCRLGLCGVAPFAGAWIEINVRFPMSTAICVSPFTRATQIAASPPSLPASPVSIPSRFSPTRPKHLHMS